MPAPADLELFNRVVSCLPCPNSAGAVGLDAGTSDGRIGREHSDYLQPFCQSVQIRLELGHHATLRHRPTLEGFTHDWEVFVRPAEGSTTLDLQCCIKRVEFHLHGSFARPKIDIDLHFVAIKAMKALSTNKLFHLAAWGKAAPDLSFTETDEAGWNRISHTLYGVQGGRRTIKSLAVADEKEGKSSGFSVGSQDINRSWSPICQLFRVVKEPPFSISESGYGGFLLPVDVYFRNPSAGPKKIRFLYDLFLSVGQSTTHIRYEKLTFRNPPEPFRTHLLSAGAVVTSHNKTKSSCTNCSLSFAGVDPTSFATGVDPTSFSASHSSTVIAGSSDLFKVKCEPTFKSPNGLSQCDRQRTTTESFLQNWLQSVTSSERDSGLGRNTWNDSNSFANETQRSTDLSDCNYSTIPLAHPLPPQPRAYPHRYNLTSGINDKTAHSQAQTVAQYSPMSHPRGRAGKSVRENTSDVRMMTSFKPNANSSERRLSQGGGTIKALESLTRKRFLNTDAPRARKRGRPRKHLNPSQVLPPSRCLHDETMMDHRKTSDSGSHASCEEPSWNPPPYRAVTKKAADKSVGRKSLRKDRCLNPGIPDVPITKRGRGRPPKKAFGLNNEIPQQLTVKWPLIATQPQSLQQKFRPAKLSKIIPNTMPIQSSTQFSQAAPGRNIITSPIRLPPRRRGRPPKITLPTPSIRPERPSVTKRTRSAGPVTTSTSVSASCSFIDACPSAGTRNRSRLQGFYEEPHIDNDEGDDDDVIFVGVTISDYNNNEDTRDEMRLWHGTEQLKREREDSLASAAPRRSFTAGIHGQLPTSNYYSPDWKRKRDRFTTPYPEVQSTGGYIGWGSDDHKEQGRDVGDLATAQKTTSGGATRLVQADLFGSTTSSRAVALASGLSAPVAVRSGANRRKCQVTRKLVPGTETGSNFIAPIAAVPSAPRASRVQLKTIASLPFNRHCSPLSPLPPPLVPSRQLPLPPPQHSLPPPPSPKRCRPPPSPKRSRLVTNGYSDHESSSSYEDDDNNLSIEYPPQRPPPRRHDTSDERHDASWRPPGSGRAPVASPRAGASATAKKGLLSRTVSLQRRSTSTPIKRKKAGVVMAPMAVSSDGSLDSARTLMTKRDAVDALLIARNLSPTRQINLSPTKRRYLSPMRRGQIAQLKSENVSLGYENDVGQYRPLQVSQLRQSEAASLPFPSSSSSSVPPSVEDLLAPNGEPMKSLMELQQRLATITDISLLRRVVKVIQLSGQQNCPEDSTFDFDLCTLDRETVQRLRSVLFGYDQQLVMQVR